MGQFDGIDEDYDVEQVYRKRKKSREEKYPFLRIFRLFLQVQGLAAVFGSIVYAGYLFVSHFKEGPFIAFVSAAVFLGGLLAGFYSFAFADLISWLVDVEEHLR